MFNSKVALAVLGALVIGGVSATAAAMAVMSAAQRTPPTVNVSRGGIVTPLPTPTPSLTPTREAEPTALPTQPPAGQGSDLHGSIASINVGASTFTLRSLGGVMRTIRVTTSTQYQGSAHSFGDLRPGMVAAIKGQFLTDGTFLASLVNAQRADE